MSLVDRWNHVENGLEPGWTEATLSLEIHDADARSRAAALLGPAGPGFSGSTVRFTVSTRGHGVGPDGVSRLLKRIDGEGHSGTARARQLRRHTRPDPCHRARNPAQHSLGIVARRTRDAARRLERRSRRARARLERRHRPRRRALRTAQSDAVDRNARLPFPLREASAATARRRGWLPAASAGSTTTGSPVASASRGVLSDVQPVGTQGAVFSIGRRPA